MRVFAFGAYGTNNVGDEAIFEGIRRLYPECVQIYINKPRIADSVSYVDVVEGRVPFGAGDYLIIGGGGLLYHEVAIQHMIALARRMREVGGRVDILRIGCEAAQESYYEAIRTLVQLGDEVSVRSALSREILAGITGRTVAVQQDFAFELAPLVGPAVGGDDDVPTIGLVTTGDIEQPRRALAEIIQLHTRESQPSPLRFVHIPHSRAYVDMRNNDCVVGQALWSSINIYHADREEQFVLEPFDPDPIAVLQRYRRLDGVMSARLHGLIFSRIVGIPALAMNGASRKTRSFVEDHEAGDVFVATGEGDLSRVFADFVAHVRADKRSRRAHLGAYGLGRPEPLLAPAVRPAIRVAR